MQKLSAFLRGLPHPVAVMAACDATAADVLARLLRESDAPFNRLSRACGFGSATRAANLFKSRFGVSMSNYRLAPERACAHARKSCSVAKK